MELNIGEIDVENDTKLIAEIMAVVLQKGMEANMISNELSKQVAFNEIDFEDAVDKIKEGSEEHHKKLEKEVIPKVKELSTIAVFALVPLVRIIEEETMKRKNNLFL